MGIKSFLTASILAALMIRGQCTPTNDTFNSASLCNYERTDRVDCSLFATPGKSACVARGCCWDDSSNPNCFFINNRPVSDPLTSTLVHLFEWSWSDIAKECAVLAEIGYTGVQVSPPQEDIVKQSTGSGRSDPWFTRYQPVSYNIFSRSGTRNEFETMIAECKRQGVDIYVDAVINHMTGLSTGVQTGRNGTDYQYRQYYGDQYTDYGNFHHRQGSGYVPGGNCQIQNLDYGNCFDCVQQCDLVSLADLDTSNPAVQKTIAAYLNDLKSMGAKGLRIDAVKHINNWDLGKILQLTDSSLAIYQEVIEGCGDIVGQYFGQYHSFGQVIEFRWAYMIHNRFTSRNLEDLGQEFMSTCGYVPAPQAVYFVENHDEQMDCADPSKCAALTYKDGNLYKVAVAFTLAYPYGTAQVMSSYTFTGHDDGAPTQRVYNGDGSDNCNSATWVCQHRFPEIANMVKWRTAAGQAPITRYYINDPKQVVQFTRGNRAMLLVNVGPSFTGFLSTTLLPRGRYCNVYVSADPAKCPVVEIDASGTSTQQVSVPRDSAVALHVNALANGASAAFAAAPAAAAT